MPRSASYVDVVDGRARAGTARRDHRRRRHRLRRRRSSSPPGEPADGHVSDGGVATIRRSPHFATNGASMPATAARGGLKPAHEPTAAAQAVAAAAQAKQRSAPGLAKTTGWIRPHAAQAPRRGDDRRRRVRQDRRRRAAYHASTASRRSLDVDTIVICAGQEPRRDLVAALEAARHPPPR